MKLLELPSRHSEIINISTDSSVVKLQGRYLPCEVTIHAPELSQSSESARTWLRLTHDIDRDAFFTGEKIPELRIDDVTLRGLVILRIDSNDNYTGSVDTFEIHKD